MRSIHLQHLLEFILLCTVLTIIASCRTGPDNPAPLSAPTVVTSTKPNTEKSIEGNVWRQVVSGTTEDLWSAWGATSDDVIAVGNRATALHNLAENWGGRATGVLGDLCDVWASTQGDAIAVGLAGTIIQYIAGEWSGMTGGISQDIYDAWGFEAPPASKAATLEAFAVGQEGVLLEMLDGEWSLMESVTDVSMFGVWGDAPDNVLAVGVGGTILRFDGSQWDFMSSPAGENLSAVWGASGEDVWAVGDVGTLLHFNGTAWSVVSVETEQNLYDVWGSAANDVWVVGAVGTILHFDGSDWTAVDSSVVESLYGIWGRSRNEAYAVGAKGTILHWGADPDDDPNVTVYVCHDHPDGSVSPPTYGLRLDKLLGDGKYTFSFDYADETESARVTLAYDSDAGEITISGRAYGGKIEQGFLSPSQSGWIDIDFSYTTNVMMVEGCGQGEGNDLYVVAESTENRGTIQLDGWGDDAVFEFTDKGDTSGCSFDLDNDRDSKDNESIANDPTVWSATGWLQPNNGGATDWLFIAEEESGDEELALNP